MTEFHKITTIEELSESGQKTALIDGVPALIIRSDDGAYHAVEDNCTHATKPLAGGEVTGNEIECPFHGARFDITTGEALCLPASQSIDIFEVEVRENEIFARKKVSEQPSPETVSKSSGNSASSDTSKNSANDTADEASADVTTGEVKGEPSLLDALKEVIDPELMVNIVDLGLIYEVCNEDGHVKVDMTLTSPACPVGPQLVQQSKMALEKLSCVNEAEINLVMSPPWSPDRMTDDARDQLGIF